MLIITKLLKNYKIKRKVKKDLKKDGLYPLFCGYCNKRLKVNFVEKQVEALQVNNRLCCKKCYLEFEELREKGFLISLNFGDNK
jgi:hypothetical protein